MRLDMKAIKEKKDFLDHAWLKKSDVYYDKKHTKLTIKLTCYKTGTKAKKKFLGLTIWDNSIPPEIPRILTINNIDSCVIQDNAPERQDVIIGGIVVKNDKVYIGSFCGRENPYGITLEGTGMYFELEDQCTEDSCSFIIDDDDKFVDFSPIPHQPFWNTESKIPPIVAVIFPVIIAVLAFLILSYFIK